MKIFIPYIFLIVAVFFGTVSNSFAKSAEGFTKLIPSIMSALTIILCMYSLSNVMKILPIGFTYSSSSKKQILSFKSYLFTKIVRFLLLQTVVSQDVTREKFAFIPHLNKYNEIFTDKILIKRWGISDDEWSFIDSKIKAIE